jgi:cholesterol transport system auxiliary component
MTATATHVRVFTTAQDSVGWVRVRATLVDPAPQGDVLLAQRVLEVRQPASAPNAAAGVQALAQGVDVLGGVLTQWLQTVSKR